MEMCHALSHAIREQRKHGGLAVIAELKRRPPNRGDLFRGRSPTEIASVYRSAGVTALSVVTSPWFGGSLRLLEEVAAANLGLPILRKDLIRTEKAIEASKRCGASAVLLVLPLLGRERLVAMLHAAREALVEPFVEVACRREIDELREIYDGIIAINNADIQTGEIEGEGIARSVALIERKDPRLWVSASRISGPEDVGTLAAAGFDGILIGTHLLLADDLRGETMRMVAVAQGEKGALA